MPDDRNSSAEPLPIGVPLQVASVKIATVAPGSARPMTLGVVDAPVPDGDVPVGVGTFRLVWYLATLSPRVTYTSPESSNAMPPACVTGTFSILSGYCAIRWSFSVSVTQTAPRASRAAAWGN